ncbi:protoporphyrinogen oxidase [Salinibacter ruber]|uniref:protoporphyrinogen/coproporphyrinogen oxidase n=1 Tax=Salinibacter ruber TaxID=146919 RepID=UPI0020738EA9|nr:FAD-dependent oxidoreductase [Salinibacter ruber]MCS3637204.1 protoporphyrinogen oxidase [Salinibacter ruber]MCS3667555.1 protoporphyrinogen oxidase [Salinibacter ruber]MCS3752933.1 protoporphyrinogen oxidase [Salinibacter ruber]MCS3821342.1 protoporphyrinogen oxidase [Salinibacter ruber]MCS3826870.1 protoporphyrinogen oxidase [Salinibacter ruber]
MSTTIDPQESPLTVLGAGPAGLATGFYARKQGLDVRLFEAADAVGGNARTLQMGPFRYDTGAHRFHDKNDAVTADVRALLGDDLRRVDAPSQICWRGRRIDFPLAPYDLLQKLSPSLLAQIAWEQLSIPRVSEDAEHFEEMALQSYGPTLAGHFLLNYTEKLWGADATTLSPRVAGDRLEGLDLKTFLLEAFGGPTQKARHLDGSFYYPKHGYGQIAEATADAIGRDRIRTGARITRLSHDDREIRQVTVNDDARVGVDSIVSTLPLTRVLHLLDPPPPEAVRSVAESMRFRHLRLVVLGLDRPRLTANASLYFPERSVPFTRLYEPKNRSPHMAPDDQTVVVLERPCHPHTEAWEQSDNTLRNSAVDLLATQGFIEGDGDVVAVDHRALPFAYPILEVGAHDKANRLKTYLDHFNNLHLLGRSARFTYTHVHNLYARARRLTERIAPRAKSVA